MTLRRPWFFALIVTGLASSFASAQSPEPTGKKIFICGHSFHLPIINPLAEIATTAGVKGHTLVGKQMIGGSRVTQHWDLPDEKNTAKKAIRASGLDVLTLAPHALLPDEGIDKFTDLLVEHDPKARVLIQASWPAMDATNLEDLITNRLALAKFTNADRDSTDLIALRKGYDSYFARLGDQAKTINARHRKALDRDVAFVVPVGHAVLTLRDKVKAGEADGVVKQADLFRDPLGHAKEVVIYLDAYCYFVAIYGRNPIGLATPAGLSKAGASDKLARQLQEIAWQTVTHEPLSGVTAPTQ